MNAAVYWSMAFPDDFVSFTGCLTSTRIEYNQKAVGELVKRKHCAADFCQ